MPSRHPQLDWGSSPDWIPVFTGMTHPLSSPLENVYFLYRVILNRKRSASDWGSIPSRHPALDTGSSPSRHPALDAGSSWIWIPVFTGMTEGGRE